MKNNRRLLIASMIAAVVVLAVPVLAMASVWKDHATGTKITKLTEFTMSGGELFEVEEKSGMSCKIHATMTTEGGSSAKITKYETTECPTGTGKLEKCVLSKSESIGLPWSVDVNTEDLTITNFHTKRTFTGCETKELDKTIASLTVTLNTPKEISELEWSGQTGTYKTVGSLEVEGTNKGTYEIG